MVKKKPTDNDIIDDIFAAVIDLAPAFKEKLLQLKREKRDAWAGDRPFIARRDGEGRSQRNEAIVRDYLRGERVALLSRRYEITERHVLRVLKAYVEPARRR
jgi:Mor family transcriptional regulator